MRQWSLRSGSPAETREIGALLGAQLVEPVAMLLVGDLGAGKTCFVQGVATGLGVSAAEPVTSPTFALMNQYMGRMPLYHFDLYRLVHPEECDDIDLEEYLAGDGVAVVEWAERLSRRELPGLEVAFTYAGDVERELSFTASGAAAESVLDRLCSRWRERRGG